jgi:hypothetical protein
LIPQTLGDLGQLDRGEHGLLLRVPAVIYAQPGVGGDDIGGLERAIFTDRYTSDAEGAPPITGAAGNDALAMDK